MPARALIATALALAASWSSAAEIVVIAHPGAAGVTKEQVADIFLGKNTSLTPIDQSESSPLYADFYKSMGRDAAQVKSARARLAFSGKQRFPQQLPDSEAVKKAVAADPKAIGYIDKQAVDGTVKTVLTLEN